MVCESHRLRHRKKKRGRGLTALVSGEEKDQRLRRGNEMFCMYHLAIFWVVKEACTASIRNTR